MIAYIVTHMPATSARRKGSYDMSATYDKTAAYYANQRTAQLRELLRRDYGAGKYRITKDDEIHAYGKMPNSIETGWYLVGYRAEVERDYQL